MATKYVTETKAGKSISAYVILNKSGKQVATVRAHFSDGGTCLVNVWDNATPEMQHATASGYGYDKFTSALSGMTIDGHSLSNHSSRDGAPKPPKGRVTFPRDYKPRKGYSLANFAHVSKATGGRLYIDHWRDLACDAMGVARPESAHMDLTDWEVIQEKAFQLESEWKVSDDCESGYTDCYKESGLKYLEAIGYRVMKAI